MDNIADRHVVSGMRGVYHFWNYDSAACLSRQARNLLLLLLSTSSHILNQSCGKNQEVTAKRPLHI